jgi:hypothetical protein
MEYWRGEGVLDYWSGGVLGREYEIPRFHG